MVFSHIYMQKAGFHMMGLIFQYLGELEELRGRTILEEDSEVTLPLITLPGTILVPGQIIPLHLFHQQMVAMIRRVVDSDKTFGVVTVKYVYL